MVGELAEVLDGPLLGVGSRRDDPACRCGDIGIGEGRHQAAEPPGSGNGIVVEKSDQIGVALRESTVPCATEAWNGLDEIAGAVLPGGSLGLLVAMGIVDNEDLVGGRVKTGNGGQALLKERWAIPRADDYSDGQRVLPYCMVLARA